jgi:hypothetical protein
MSETPSSPLKTTWEAAFTDIRNSSTSVSPIRFVFQSAVSGVPAGFYPVEGNAILPTFKGHNLGVEFIVRELGPIYVVTNADHSNTDVLNQFRDGPFETSNKQSGIVPTDRAPGVTPSDDSTQQGISSGQKAAGGALVLYAAYKGLQALGSSKSSTGQSAPSDEGTGPSLSRLARAANRLDDKQYNLFVSHSWGHGEHYERIVEFLDEVPSLEWQNHSVPSTDPLPVNTDEALRSELRTQMRTASVVIVSSGMYGAHSKWIPVELDLADELGKPVIAIVPEGQSKVPTKIQEVANTQVGWRKASLVNALAEYV